jgi:hypothetical protein
MGSVDFDAIGVALAARFAAAQITAPTSEQTIRLATSEIPNQLNTFPAVVVFPPEVEMAYLGGIRSGVAVFPVGFYLPNLRDRPRNARLLNKWLKSLYAQMDVAIQFGGVAYVTWAEMFTTGTGQVTYADEPYEGIDLAVHVHFWEPLGAVA